MQTEAEEDGEMKRRIECKRFNPLTVQKHLDQF